MNTTDTRHKEIESEVERVAVKAVKQSRARMNKKTQKERKELEAEARQAIDAAKGGCNGFVASYKNAVLASALNKVENKRFVISSRGKALSPCGEAISYPSIEAIVKVAQGDHDAYEEGTVIYQLIPVAKIVHGKTTTQSLL